MTPDYDDSAKRLIRQRLTLEASLRHRDIALRIHEGRIFVGMEAGIFPINIRELPPAGFSVEMRVLLGTCPEPGEEFQAFVADVNACRETPVLEVANDGTTALCWNKVFEGSIDANAVVLGMMELAELFAQTGSDLRERFFITPADGGDSWRNDS